MPSCLGKRQHDDTPAMAERGPRASAVGVKEAGLLSPPIRRVLVPVNLQVAV